MSVRVVVLVVGLGGLTLLAAGCGGSPGRRVAHLGSTTTLSRGSSNARGSATSQLLAFSRCMRAHGVPNFPDPPPEASNAKFPNPQQLGVSSVQFQAAQTSCQHLLPAGVDDQFPPAEVPLLLRGMVRFSQCMRTHGVPNWPDPTVDSDGRPFFRLSAHGFTLQQAHSPQLQARVAECQHLLPSALGGLPTG